MGSARMQPFRLNAIRLMGDTSNIDGVVTGSRQLVAVLSQAKDESGSIPAGLRETAKAAAQAAIEALKLQGNTKEADRIAKLFASNPMVDPITAANTRRVFWLETRLRCRNAERA